MCHFRKPTKLRKQFRATEVIVRKVESLDMFKREKAAMEWMVPWSWLQLKLMPMIYQSCYHMWPHSMYNNLYHLSRNLSWHMIEFQWNEIELSWGSENEFLNWSKAELCSGWHIGIDKGGEKEGKDGGASNMRKQE